MSLMARLMASRLAKAVAPAPTRLEPAAPVPTSAPASSPPPSLKGPRGSCKAFNADTGRQCCLLAGHAGVHRHGRTDFTRVAEAGQTSFRRRDALDAAASSRPGSTFTNPQGGIAHD